jgi:DNA-binding SARP family transcriptional activator
VTVLPPRDAPASDADQPTPPALTLNLLGGMELLYGRERLALPQSRKTRALLAMLALAERPLRRERLCEIFWQLPDDPRGALRWSLSKLRSLLSVDGTERIRADRSEVRLDRSGLQIDALRLRDAPAGADAATLEALARQCRGGFLDDLDLPDAFEFRAWRIAERESLRAAEIRLRRRLLDLGGNHDTQVAHAFRLVEIAPEEPAHHRALLATLSAAGRAREAAEQRRLSLDQLRDLGVPAARLDAPAQPSPASAPVPGPAARARPVSVPDLIVSGFRSIGGGDDDLAQAVTDEVSRVLSRMPWFLTVVEPAGEGTNAPEADYLLSGTLIRAGNRLRVTYRLLDRGSGHHVLSDRMEIETSDVLSALDEIAGRIGAAMEPTIRLAELEALRRRPAREDAAYYQYLRGWSLAFGQTGMDVPAAIRHFTAALELDREHAPSALMIAWLGMQQRHNLNPEGMRRCADLARTALRYASNDGAIIAHAAYVLMFCERDWDMALDLAAKARALSPFSPQTWFSVGWVYLCTGDPAEALACFECSRGYNVTHPFAYIADTGRANALLQLGATAEAATVARAATNDNPTFHPSWRVLAAALALSGEDETAAAAALRLRELAPHESIAFVRKWLPYRLPDHLELLCTGLSKAGLPDV